MASRIVVPLDGSKLAEAVLHHVEGYAKLPDAEVHFVQVVDVGPRLVSARTPVAATVDESERATKSAGEYLEALAAGWKAKGIDARCDVVTGVAATSIVNFARSHEATLIAMSTHGRSGLSRLVFGSVADQVVREAGMPVLVVRPGHEEK